MMTVWLDPDELTADIKDPFGRRQARIAFQAYNEIWGAKPPRSRRRSA